MAVHQIEPVAPTWNIPRMWPCGAYLEQAGRECGATPALLFRRVCGHGHSKDVWLCRTHEQVISLFAVCRDCANHPTRAHRCPVALVKVPEAAEVIRAGMR